MSQVQVRRSVSADGSSTPMAHEARSHRESDEFLFHHMRSQRHPSVDSEGSDGLMGQHRLAGQVKGLPRLKHRSSAPSRRTSSVDSNDATDFIRGGQQETTEVGLSKVWLQTEIEAQSQKISAQSRQRSLPKRSNSFEYKGVETPKESSRRRLLVVSARLPFTVIYDEETGDLDVEHDPFVTNIADLLAGPPVGRRHGMPGLQNVQVRLLGAPVVRKRSDRSLVSLADGEIVKEVDRYLRRELQVVPVFPPPGRDRFADWVIFPLFHYSPPSMETGLGLYDWDGYVLINETFRDAVLQEYIRGNLVWINDYPLMLLPKLLRKERPEICIGFYMHCVFPSSEVYRILPQREHLLRGVLSANVIGFHTFQYVRHFLTSCTRVLGLECTASGIEACEDAGGTCTKAISVPMGINLDPYIRLLNKEEAQNHIQSLADTFAGQKILVAIDRLEDKRGIPHKIMAFHKFLQKAPIWKTQCIFVQIVEVNAETLGEDSVDGATSDENQSLLQRVYQLVGEVNSNFGTIGHLPLHFLVQEFHKVDIVSLLVRAHVFLDTPLRDTLSQKAHEFLCCQQDKDCGVLIMSEFSGSAQSLRAAALCVNPWDTNGFADAIQEALEMDTQDRLELHRYGHRYVNEYTLKHWAATFLDEIQTAESDIETERVQIPPRLDHDRLVATMRRARRRLLIFGFSGTLLPRKSKIHAKILPKLPQVLHGNLQVIAEDPNTEVIIVSGFARHALDQALGDIPCWIIAEGGVCFREPGQEEFVSSVDDLVTDWIAPVKEIMEYFAARTPGSTVIETSSSVSWHYQKTQGDHAAIQSKDLLIHLWAGPLLSAPAEVVVGSDSVSVRPTGVNKASQLERVLNMICTEEGAGHPDKELWMRDACVLCITDLITRDEDVFTSLQKIFDTDETIAGSDRVGSGLEAREPRISTGSDSRYDSWDWGGNREKPDLGDRNMEVNSRSLNFTLSHGLSASTPEDPNIGPFGLHKPGSSSGVQFPSGSLLFRTPSEPGDVQAAKSVEDATTSEWPGSDALDGSGNGVALFTCTVHRKATRAMFHVSDTSDVAFLIAKMAREVRQARQSAADLEPPS